MRPLLVGESNPHGAEPRDALWPAPPGSAGARLACLLGLTACEYLRRFERTNLLPPGPWSAPLGRERAATLLAGRDVDAPLVLLGRRVAGAFGARAEAFSRVLLATGHAAVLLPHPSSRCSSWNEPGAAERARAVLRDAGILVEPRLRA